MKDDANPRYTDIAARYLGGETLEQICAAAGCERSTVYHALRRCGVDPKVHTHKLVERIRELAAAGHAHAAIREATGLNVTRLRKLIYQYGIKIRHGLPLGVHETRAEVVRHLCETLGMPQAAAAEALKISQPQVSLICAQAHIRPTCRDLSPVRPWARQPEPEPPKPKRVWIFL